MYMYSAFKKSDQKIKQAVWKSRVVIYSVALFVSGGGGETTLDCPSNETEKNNPGGLKKILLEVGHCSM
jgi:hypothetical protein